MNAGRFICWKRSTQAVEHLYAIDNMEVVSRHADLMPPVVVGSAHQTVRRNFHALLSVISGRRAGE
jgi:hypothetical protein